MKMITVASSEHHRITPISIYVIFIILSPEITNLVRAQSEGRGSPNTSPPYATFTPPIAIIIAILIAALFFMGFFSIYIRHCSDAPGGNNVARRALSMGNRRASAARGLDATVLETFPMFSYSEVKDHKIAKGVLECAVCLCEFEDHETLRLIPKCDHVFHPECIDAWLESHVTCPVCRANLIPQPGDEPFKLQADNSTEEHNSTIDRSNSINEEFIVQVDGSNQNQESKMNQNLSMENPNRPPRSWSMKMFGRGKFRSHSTGHSVIQPDENLDRFTLRLPAHVRKEMMDRAALNRTGSCLERNSKREYAREGSNRVGRFNRMDDGEAKSDRWVFFRRAFSMRSPKLVAENGQGSSHEGSKIPVKLSSFKCLEPRAADETVLFSGEHS